jgi:hypothetical protein
MHYSSVTGAPSSHSAPNAGPVLFVASLATTVDDLILHQLFAHYGHVISASVVRDRATNASKGWFY